MILQPNIYEFIIAELRVSQLPVISSTPSRRTFRIHRNGVQGREMVRFSNTDCTKTYKKKSRRLILVESESTWTD